MSSFLNPNPANACASARRPADGATPVTGAGSSSGASKALLRAAIAATSLLCSAPAFANGSFYYDLAGGIAKYQQTSPFFSNATQGSTNTGYAFNNGIFVNFGGDTRAFAYQLGIQHRLSGAADATGNYAIQTAYPVLRLQFSRLFVGAGYTPFVWKRSSTDSGLEGFSSAKNTTAMLLEAGLLAPVTPKLSFGAQGGLQYISGGGVKGPSPAWDITGSMRFYFGFFGHGGGGSESSGEFKGWRYPFGMIR